MIISAKNQQIKNLIQLNKKSKYRNEKELFVIEGIKLFQEAPKERIESIYISESLFNRKEHVSNLKDFQYEVVKDDIFEKISDTKTPQGIICIVRQFKHVFEDLKKQANAHFILLEDLQDPGNVGTIFRTAEGAGITGIILSKSTVDIYNPKTIRSTMGSIFRVPFVYVEDFYQMLIELKKSGIKTYAAALDGERYYDQENYNRSFGFVIGNEGNGLSSKALSLVDSGLKIPMEGKVESLNAAIAAGILMYEAYRQRR
ncbi:TrmH family RNA methyltransferase [Anaerosacchariphilus polymeriproducens]|uniref:RNA methyltransferase n=1 Tax=Anaerosacchariphilus polymeriproducens TaxID=1812858 RepID=A0A371AX91_9FIRM|nr:RNA methyltransferase [Anaerosacchariphilus polymeriproducens]RDU24196.1 RNA methyltransferase [Anaerosacchariphilus polymeriproducens]